MILHIGCDEFLPVSSIVAILSAPAGERPFPSLPPALPAGAPVKNVGPGPVKSVIIAASGGRCVFFLSPISARTLRRRCESGTIN